jgi:hypothetical protein
MALGSGAYVADDERLGLVAFGGVLTRRDGGAVHVATRDAVRKRVFIGPLGAYISVDAGIIGEFSYVEGTGDISLVLSQAGGPRAEHVVVWIESASPGQWKVTGATEARGGSQVTMAPSGTTVVQIRRI